MRLIFFLGRRRIFVHGVRIKYELGSGARHGSFKDKERCNCLRHGRPSNEEGRKQGKRPSRWTLQGDYYAPSGRMAVRPPFFFCGPYEIWCSCTAVTNSFVRQPPSARVRKFGRAVWFGDLLGSGLCGRLEKSGRRAPYHGGAPTQPPIRKNKKAWKFWRATGKTWRRL